MAPLSPKAVFGFPEVSRKGSFLRSDAIISQNNSNFDNSKDGYFTDEFSQFNDPKICDFLENKFDFLENRSFYDRDFGSERSDLYSESPIECIDEWESRNSYEFNEYLELNGENLDLNMGPSGEKGFSGEVSWREFSNSSTSTSSALSRSEIFSEISGRENISPAHPPKKNKKNGLRRTSSLPTNIICQDAEKACDALEMDAARSRIKEAASHVWEAEQLLTALRLQEDQLSSENFQSFEKKSGRNSGHLGSSGNWGRTSGTPGMSGFFRNEGELSGKSKNISGRKMKDSGTEKSSFRKKNFEFEDILGAIFDNSGLSESEEGGDVFEKKSKYGIFSKRGSNKENAKLGSSKSTVIRSMWVWVSGFGSEKTKKGEEKTKNITLSNC